MLKRLRFLVTSRYPTEKAYGVTIGRTCEALRRIGVDASIYAPTKGKKDDFGNTVHDIQSHLKRTFPAKQDRSRVSLAFDFLLDSIGTAKAIRREIQGAEPIIIVSRDWVLAIVLSFYLNRGCVAFEVHRHIPKLKKLLMVCFIVCRDVKTITITEQSFMEWKKWTKRDSLMNIPMGVDDSFFRVKSKEKHHKEIRMCFVGKGTSSGFDNGLLSFVQKLSSVSKKERRINLGLVGISHQEFMSLQRYENYYLELNWIEHVTHAKIAILLDDYEIGIVPYPDNTYHRFRYPIKILEYAAAGLSIVASDTIAHRKILNNDIAHFFSLNDSESLARCIDNITSNGTDELRRCKLAQNWARKFTYTERAKKYSSFLLSESGSI